MKFSEYWLRNWVNPNINTDELCDQLTMAGLEVDGCEAVAGEFTGVVIGKVVECQQHPNADKLRVTKVDVGQSELLNIVCGAPNCRQGLMVACATVGAVLPGDFKIKPAKLRGEPSEGMLCSYSELGISSDEDGIIELPEDAPIGMNVREFLKLDDHAIEISITPNRGDCFSIMGVARDISAINNLPINLPEIVPVQATLNDTISITLAEPEAAPKYLGRIIKGVNVKAETPIWMKEQLRRGGIRSIDPIVDVTNYVLLELGHPMHAFDLNKIEGGITVRYGRPNEKITLLDGNEVTIKDKTVVISDDKKALALGGIFGGAGSGVTTDTQDILLEAAYFNPVAIAGKAREYGLHTESSHRYERGVDPELQHRAMERATALILEICGGAAGNVIESVNEAWLPKAKVITLRREKLDSLIGYVIESNLVSDILTKLGFKVESQGENWSVTIPSWRFDCAIEADLVEEVARIYGYNRIPNQTLLAGLTMKPNSEKVMSVNRLKLLLVDQGYQEAITYSFVDPKTQALLHPSKPFMQLPNPISSEMSAMRLSLWTGLIDAVLYNQNRQQSRVKLFETGLRFIPDASSEFEIRQESVLSGVVTGNRDDENWAIKEAKFDFFDLKGEIEVLLSHIKGTHQLTYQRSSNPALHPGQSAEVLIDGRCVGEFGVLHPEIQKKLDLNSTTLVFELSLEGICQKSLPQAKDLSKFPSNRRDIAVVVDNNVAVADLLNVIKTEAGDTLVKVTVFDLYQGDNIRAGAKSLALSLILQNKERTLDDQEITDIVSKCVLALKNQFNAQLR